MTVWVHTSSLRLWAKQPYISEQKTMRKYTAPDAWIHLLCNRRHINITYGLDKPFLNGCIIWIFKINISHLSHSTAQGQFSVLLNAPLERMILFLLSFVGYHNVDLCTIFFMSVWTSLAFLPEKARQFFLLIYFISIQQFALRMYFVLH